MVLKGKLQFPSSGGISFLAGSSDGMVMGFNITESAGNPLIGGSARHSLLLRYIDKDALE
jgi:hypothetical protein